MPVRKCPIIWTCPFIWTRWHGIMIIQCGDPDYCTVRLLEALHHIRGASFYVNILPFVRQDPPKFGTIYGTINALNNKCFY